MQRPCAPGEPLAQLGHQGCTPLHIAAQHGDGEVVQQLIAAGTLGVDLKTSRPKVERGHTVGASVKILWGR